jgi:hypothetical protein
MLKFDIGDWVLQVCPKGSTHALKGSFADPEFDAKPATDLFCYNQNSRTGAFFATGKKDSGDNGPHRVGENHAFVRRWTHLVYIPIFSFVANLPYPYKLILFYEAASGMAEVYETDGKGNLNLRKQHNGWRTSWTQIIAGQFGKANLLFYDATNKIGEFCFMNISGDIQFIEGWS